jgi:hypothetical protein
MSEPVIQSRCADLSQEAEIERLRHELEKANEHNRGMDDFADELLESMGEPGVVIERLRFERDEQEHWKNEFKDLAGRHFERIGELERELAEARDGISRIAGSFAAWFGECGCGDETCPTCNVERVIDQTMTAPDQPTGGDDANG